MERIVLIGSNIAHSRSPHIHNHLFRKYGLPYRYELMPLSPEGVLPALETMKRGGYRGANVTSPHKQIVMPGLDRLSDEARVTGAANTIVFEGGEAAGHNTDVAGFDRALSAEMSFESPFTAAVLGTGGAALAALHVLLRKENLVSLVLYSRDRARADAVAARWNDERLKGGALEHFSPAGLVVHATPVGLAGDPGSLLDAERLAGCGLLYEMIYSPAETALMRAARDAGVRAVGGIGMFIAQALGAFTLWTGIEVEASEMPMLQAIVRGE